MNTLTLPVKPKILPQRQKAMTCIVGMRCQDGVVLGADMEIDDPYTKTPESKIRQRIEGTVHPYFFAYTTANVEAAKESINQIKRAITNTPPGERITTFAKEQYKKEFADDPESNLALIWAFNPHKKYRLHHMSNGHVSPDETHVINGSGYIHSLGLMNELYQSDMTLRDGAALAVYLLKVAKIRAVGVGFQSQVLMLSDSGKCSMLSSPFVEHLENCYWSMHTGLQSLILNYTRWRDVGFDVRVKEFAKRTKTNRAKIRKAYDLLPHEETCDITGIIPELLG